MISTSQPDGVSGEFVLEVLRALSDRREASTYGIEWTCLNSFYEAAKAYYFQRPER
jgi:hypothetical protein